MVVLYLSTKGTDMNVIKLYRSPNKPEYMALICQVGDEILVNYPIDVRYGKRTARWFNINEVYIDWIRRFACVT
jgi:hypothetical protein